MAADVARELGSTILAAWTEPASPAAARACRLLAEAVTGIPLPLPISPDDVERLVAVARRNREYSAAHTDAMLPGDPPILPGLLARAEALDAKERVAFADRLEEWDRRLAMDADVIEAEDVRLAAVLRSLVLGLAQDGAAVLCLRHGLAGEPPRPVGEVARALGTDPATVRAIEADALAALRDPARTRRLRDVLDAAVASSLRAYP